jgi:lipid A 3-O-deacylase
MKNFKPIYFTALLVLSTLFNSQNMFANTLHFNTDKSNSLSQAIAIDVLIGEDNVSGIRLSYRPHTYTIENVPYFKTLDVYWELSANFWEYGQIILATTFLGGKTMPFRKS